MASELVVIPHEYDWKPYRVSYQQFVHFPIDILYSVEVKGEIEGTINKAVLHDIAIFKQFFDFDFEPICEALSVDTFDLVKQYESSSEFAGRIRRNIFCESAEG